MNPDVVSGSRLDINAIFAAYAERPAIVRHGKAPAVYTFGDVARRVAYICAKLCSMGMGPGSRLALYAENDPVHFMLFFAAWINNILFVPLNRALPFDAAVKDAAPDVVITGDCCLAPGYETGAVFPEAPPHPYCISAESLLQGMPQNDTTLPVFTPVALDRECSLVFTSGSTGKPRGVVHTISNHVYSALGAISFLGLTSANRWLITLPLNHVGGLSVFTRTFLSGAAAVFPETRHRTNDAIMEQAADFISLVPTQLIRYMTAGPTAAGSVLDRLKSMRAILLGGAPAPGWVIDKALDESLPIVPSYGSTESCSLVTAVPPGSKRSVYKTAGRVLPYRKLALDADGRILLAGKTRFAYYLEGGKKVFPFQDGWFKTADLGETDDHGNWIITGRCDEIFISGGENINPYEIENHLMAIGGIDAAVVVPAPHPEFGHVPWAFIVSSRKMDPEKVSAALRKTLPGFKIPVKMMFVDPQETAGGIKADRRYFKKKAARMAGDDT